VSKQCGGPCQKWLPSEYFDKDSSKPDGYRLWCKSCRKAKRDAAAQAAEEKEIVNVVQEIEAPILATLSDGNRGGTNLPHESQMLERVIELLGGVDGLAAFYVAQILAAPPGSVIRERMLNRVWSAIEHLSDESKTAKPIHQMTDKELEAKLIAYGMPLRIVDARVEVKEDARQAS
jgi:hypothetical protein